jgi:hypothetical protein
MTSYHDRKLDRTLRHQAQHGLKLITCGACNGSGRYDHNGSPPCGCCKGTGKVRERLPTEPSPPLHWREALSQKIALRKARRTAGLT